MLTPLHVFLVRHTTDSESFLRSQAHPVLVFESREDDATGAEVQSDVSYRLKTLSAVSRPFSGGGGEQLVAEVYKQKDNAFPRGVTLGRTGNNDLVVDDPSVSRFHCWLQRAEGGKGWMLADAGSKNGTTVDGVRLRPKKPVLLRPHEHLLFGDVRAQYFVPQEFARFLRRFSELSAASK